MTPGISKCSASASVSFIQVSITRALRTFPVFFMPMISWTLSSNESLSACSFSPIQRVLFCTRLVCLVAPASFKIPSRPSPLTGYLSGDACLLWAARWRLFETRLKPFSASTAVKVPPPYTSLGAWSWAFSICLVNELLAFMLLVFGLPIFKSE